MRVSLHVSNASSSLSLSFLVELAFLACLGSNMCSGNGSLLDTSLGRDDGGVGPVIERGESEPAD